MSALYHTIDCLCGACAEHDERLQSCRRCGDTCYAERGPYCAPCEADLESGTDTRTHQEATR